MRPNQQPREAPQRLLERDSSISSVSSTVTVDPQANKSLSDITFYVPSQQQQLQHQQQPKPRRHVWFDERANEHHENHLYCEEDCHLLWYTEDQYAAFKSDTKTQIFAAIEAEFEEDANPNSYANVMKEVYQYCCALAKEEDDEEALADAQQHVLPKALRKRFATMLAQPCNAWRLGLHTYAVEGIKEGKDERRRTVVEVVTYLQEEYHWEERKCVEQATAEVCQNVSRSTRLFAMCMAQAQCKR